MEASPLSSAINRCVTAHPSHCGPEISPALLPSGPPATHALGTAAGCHADRLSRRHMRAIWHLFWCPVWQCFTTEGPRGDDSTNPTHDRRLILPSSVTTKPSRRNIHPKTATFYLSCFTPSVLFSSYSIGGGRSDHHVKPCRDGVRGNERRDSANGQRRLWRRDDVLRSGGMS